MLKNLVVLTSFSKIERQFIELKETVVIHLFYFKYKG